MIRARSLGSAVILETTGSDTTLGAWTEGSIRNAEWKVEVLNAFFRCDTSAFERIEHCHQWYAVRWQRLRDLINDNACHIIDEACCIMGNGTADHMEPPTYSQQMNALRQENARLRAALVPLAGEYQAVDDNTHFLVKNSLLRKAKEALG